MGDKHHPTAAQPRIDFVESTQSERKRFSFSKGGFDPQAVAAAEKRLAEAAAMFPKIAAGDLDVIAYALGQLEHATQIKQWLERMQWAAAELKSNGDMFQYPLVGAIAHSLYTYLESNSDVSVETARRIVALHLKTMRDALEKGPGAITADDYATWLKPLAEKITSVQNP